MGLDSAWTEETYKQPSGLIGGKQKKLKKSLPLPEEESSGHWAARLPQHGVGGRLDSFVLGNKLRVYGKCMNTPKISELFFPPLIGHTETCLGHQGALGTT